MSKQSKMINAALKQVLDLIQRCEPGHGRDVLQARFDLTIDRIAQIPERVMLQFDAGTIGSNIEFDDVRRTELLWALDPLNVGKD
jgi:hypothetical protein